MQFKNPFIDNLSKVMADAFGAAHSAKNEAENVFKTWLDGWLADRAENTALTPSTSTTPVSST